MALNGKLIVALVLLSVIVVSGCTSPQKAAAPSLASRPFVGGTQGIEVAFQPNAPPEEVVKGDQIEFIVKLENKGESAAKVRKVSLTGISASAFGIHEPVDDTIRDLSAVGKVGTTLVPGGQDIVTFTSPGYTGTLEGQFPFTATAVACYDYKSQGVATACITENLLQQATGANACKTSGMKQVYNKGATVQVTSVEQIPFGRDTLGFQIKIKNVGTGRVFNSDDCVDKSMSADKVVVTSVKLGSGLELNCGRTDNTFSLVNGEANVICRTAPGELVDQYTGIVEDLLTIDLEYNYESKASKKFVLKALPGTESESGNQVSQ